MIIIKNNINGKMIPLIKGKLMDNEFFLQLLPLKKKKI